MNLSDSVQIIRVGCPAHNCGGRFLFVSQLEVLNGYVPS